MTQLGGRTHSLAGVVSRRVYPHDTRSFLSSQEAGLLFERLRRVAESEGFSGYGAVISPYGVIQYGGEIGHDTAPAHFDMALRKGETVLNRRCSIANDNAAMALDPTVDIANFGSLVPTRFLGGVAVYASPADRARKRPAAALVFSGAQGWQDHNVCVRALEDVPEVEMQLDLYTDAEIVPDPRLVAASASKPS